MDHLLNSEAFKLTVTFILTALGSSGLWGYVMKRMELKSLDRQLLIGLSRERISCLAQSHIREGCISQDNYEILMGLYEPYSRLGGNGTIKKLMNEVEKLRLKTNPVTRIHMENFDDDEQ